MSTQWLAATEYSTLVNSSHKLSANVRQLVSSVNELEEAYRIINAATSSLPITCDADNVVRQALMKSILQRDMDALSASILILMEPVKHFVSVLLQSAEQMFEVCTLASSFATGQEAVVDLAKAELAESIEVLKELNLRLSKIGMH